jgi:hypothetical protein
MTEAQLLALIDHLTAERDELRRDKERALHTLHLMRGTGVIDLPKLERTLKGQTR